MILNKLAQFAALRVEEAKGKIPLEELRERAKSLGKDERPFEAALQQPSLSMIAEIKKASPSKGIIAETFDYLAIAEDYEAGGADCISCLTEPKWFLGSDEIFREIRKQSALPMLRKDFTVDAYQLYEAKCMGADAVLLICALLDTKTIASYLEICEDLGLSALVEAHNEGEIASALSAGAKILGVNNRNLKDFSVDPNRAARLRDQIPPSVLYVAESGVQGPEDVARLAGIGADGVLIGEALMRAADRRAYLSGLRSAGR